MEIPDGLAPSGIPFTWYILDVPTKASFTGFIHSIPCTMYASMMTVLSVSHWLREVMVSRRLWLLRQLLMNWIAEKLTVDVLCSQDDDYKELFQAMIEFRRKLTVHDRVF